MTTMDNPFSWALLPDDNLINADQVYDIARALRTEYRCPACKEPLIARTGEVNRPHFAHRPGSACVVARNIEASRETADHFNAKNAFAQKLRQCKSLWIVKKCEGNHQKRYSLVARDWDTVQVEYQDEVYRPDIALLKNGNAIGFIEILVTHAIYGQKAYAYVAQGIPFVELRPIQANSPDNYQDGIVVWSSFSIPSIPEWECERCQRERNMRRERTHERHQAGIYWLRAIVDRLESEGQHGMRGNVVSQILARYGLDREKLANPE